MLCFQFCALLKKGKTLWTAPVQEKCHKDKLAKIISHMNNNIGAAMLTGNNRGPPVQVICVVPVQLIASVSSGVTSFILGLYHVWSSRPRLRVLSLLPLHMMSRRFPEAVGLLWGAAGAVGDPAVLVQRLSTAMAAAVSRETTQEEDMSFR